MSQHTPGPWRANYRRIEHGPFVAGDGFLLATMSLDSPEHEANARLIAAAPELLAVLQESLRWIGKVAADHDDDGTGLDRRAMKAHEAARAAIAKATGEEGKS